MTAELVSEEHPEPRPPARDLDAEEQVALEVAWAAAERAAIALEAQEVEPIVLEPTTTPPDDGERAIIVLGPDLAQIVDAAIEALAARDVYQRQGTLVDVVRDGTTDPHGVVRPVGSPRIRMLPSPRLREMLSVACDFRRRCRGDDGEWTSRSVPPPADVVATLSARGQWAHIRRLSGIATYPVLRPDRSVLATAGYDLATALICEPSCRVELRAPTREAALSALAELHELVCDFPFATGAHRSAWLAALLTLLARPAIDGPAPLTLIDANERGAGKTLLADLLGVVTTGKSLPRRTAPDDAAEWRKAMLGIAIAADPVILIDNVTRMLRSDALDAVLTGMAYRDRILGKNEELTIDVRTVFLATANNATISTDLVRRSVHVRLDVAAERPERRTGFRFADLLGHARAERARYQAAALMVLRAYELAGRPPVELLPMGSYEAWSAEVRAPLVWLGEADPAATQDALRDAADPEGDALGELLPAWHDVYGDRAVTVRQLRTDMSEPGLCDRDARLAAALAALADGPGLPSGRRLGYELRKLRGRMRGGYALEGPRTGGQAHWKVRRA